MQYLCIIFFSKLIADLQNSIHFITGLLLYKFKLTAARLKKGTTQWFRLSNSARIFINLSWYELKSYAQKFGSVRFGFGKKFLVRSFPRLDLISDLIPLMSDAQLVYETMKFLCIIRQGELSQLCCASCLIMMEHYHIMIKFYVYIET